jgi:hypothetical protein
MTLIAFIEFISICAILSSSLNCVRHNEITSNCVQKKWNAMQFSRMLSIALCICKNYIQKPTKDTHKYLLLTRHKFIQMLNDNNEIVHYTMQFKFNEWMKVCRRMRTRKSHWVENFRKLIRINFYFIDTIINKCILAIKIHRNINTHTLDGWSQEIRKSFIIAVMVISRFSRF